MKDKSLSEIEFKMDSTIEKMIREFNSIRTGELQSVYLIGF